MNIIQSVNGIDMNLKMEMGTKVNYKVTAIKDSIYEMEISVFSKLMNAMQKTHL